MPSVALPAAQVPSDVIGETRVPVDSELKSTIPPPTAYAPVKTTSPESKRSKGNRHTIQVEYGESES